VLKLLHTADLHLGREHGQLDQEDRRKVARARLEVVEQILSLADQHGVDAVLWAGDIFDTPDPPEDWWRGFGEALRRRAHWTRPIVLLPGNHDPLIDGSVFEAHHQFRALLPDCVQVVDRDAFEIALGSEGVLYASPCRSRAFSEDLAMSLPARVDGDQRIRVGLVHGSTFDLEGYQTNFPIARDAPARRGFDYLAVGDTHGFREILGEGPAPIVYPGTPEPTSFGESDAGHVALVSLRRAGARPTVVRQHVARWTWRDEIVTTLQELRRLATEDLSRTVLRLRLSMEVSPTDGKEVNSLTGLLKGNLASSGRAGALILDVSGLRQQPLSPEQAMEGAPETLVTVAQRLAREAPLSDEARRALEMLYRSVSEAAQ
jgi:DNA repair exonuclease SbcCD nuclease subunit